MEKREIQDKKPVKRSSEKQFIRTMIITGVVGLSIMMITMLYIIKAFGTKKVDIKNEPSIPPTTKETEVAVENKATRGIIHDKGAQGKNIKVWDIQESQYIQMKIKDNTQLKDSYGKPMSIQEVQIGEILEITYEAKSKDVIAIQKSASAWTKSDVMGLEIDVQNKTITLGNNIYEYTSNMLITNNQREVVDITAIGEFDTLRLEGMNNMIWSIQVLESPGYIKLSNIPTQEGTIEIDNNQIYPLEGIEENIPLSQGAHKIVIQMQGYHPFVEQVNIIEDVVYEIDLKDVEKAISTLQINVVNTPVDYMVQIDNKRYKKGEAVQVEPGTYTLKLTADGFEPFERKIELKAGDQLLDITLETKQEQAEQPKSEPEQSKPQTENKTDQDNKEEIKTVQIIIETEPAQAEVFISGVYKGVTPALTGLKPGEYNISIEKEGYSTLYTTIIIDSSNRQKSFLYTLEKE